MSFLAAEELGEEGFNASEDEGDDGDGEPELEAGLNGQGGIDPGFGRASRLWQQ